MHKPHHPHHRSRKQLIHPMTQELPMKETVFGLTAAGEGGQGGANAAGFLSGSDHGREAPGQLNRSWMSSAVMAPDVKSPESMTLANRADFLAFKAMTFSSRVSLATRR
jgi:hypothetical protein